MSQKRITDDLQILLGILPDDISATVTELNHSDDLIEIVMDLGRRPKARFVDHEAILSDERVSREQLDHVVGKVGDFDADNRAGLERTLHRISALRNRHGAVVGLTCRVGRAVYGTIGVIQDLVESGKSLLLLGKPGVGKTTMLREAARILSEKKRVVIVDTSNEIGGDGDVPHPAIGHARRMQVPTPSLQHEVMIEAVENHNPEVIVIDEIGRQLEAEAARTIAERGVQLVGTAHGRSLENLLLNPTLSDLIGGIESVTLSDEEARRRGTQKTVLERRSAPTFDVLVEILVRHRVAVHPDVSAAVDLLVRNAPVSPEVRWVDENDQIHYEQAPAIVSANPKFGGMPLGHRRSAASGIEPYSTFAPKNGRRSTYQEAAQPAATGSLFSGRDPVKIYPYGVARNRLLQAAKRLGVPLVVVKDIQSADSLITLRSYYRSRHQTIVDAETRGLPIYVLRANTVSQIEQSLSDVFHIPLRAANGEEPVDISAQTSEAIQAVINGQHWVDMPPANADTRQLQHEMAREAHLVSHSYGKEPYRRVRIFKE